MTINAVLMKHPWTQGGKRHSLHGICSRICSFPPAMVRHFIVKNSQKGDLVFDPFSGKGTVPLESLLQGRVGWGNDVSPEAYILTKAKISSINLARLQFVLDGLRGEMGFIKSVTDVDQRVRVFYDDRTLKQIMELKTLINSRNTKYATFVKALMLGILHGSSSISLSLKCSHSYSMSPNYVKNFADKNGLVKPERDVISCLKQKATETLKDSTPILKGKAFNSDSRHLKIINNSVDLIITSPPYFAVQTYAYDNWLRLWFLGYDHKDVNKILVNTDDEEKYGNFMHDSLKEMYRILKPGKKCFIVVGDVKKRLSKGIIIINTAKFLQNYAEETGFKVNKIIIDTIPQSRKVFNSSLTSTGISTERILCLEKP